MKKLNWNSKVKVRLTDKGKSIYFHQWDDFIKKGAAITPTYPDMDEDGYCEMQLWQFMSLYGEHIGLCKTDIVHNIAFYISDDDLHTV